MAKFSKLKVNTLSNSRDNTSDIFSTFILWNGRILQHCIGNTVFRNTALLLTSGRINGKLGLLKLMPLCWWKYSFIDSSFPSAVVILIRCIFHILYNILFLKIWSWQHQINCNSKCIHHFPCIPLGKATKRFHYNCSRLNAYPNLNILDWS